MTSSRVLLLLVAALSLDGALSAAPIFTSSFSEVAVVTPKGYDEHQSGTLGPWTLGGGGVDLVGSYWQSADGDGQSIDLNDRRLGSISTALPTVAGHTYQVAFYMAGNPDTLSWGLDYWPRSNSVKTIEVSAGGSSQQFSFDIANGLGAGIPSTRSNMGWVYYTFTFTAQSTADVLTFLSLGPRDPWGAALDAISVTDITGPTPIPEPATFMLLGAGLAGFAFARKRQ